MTNLYWKSRKILHILIFVNTVKLMNELVNPKNNNWLAPKSPDNSQFSERGLYVREDDQDWGSAGMNDIQKDSK